MKFIKLAMLSLIVIGCLSTSGCGDGGNKIIEPTKYELTDQEKKNAERIAEELAKGDR